MDDLVHPALVGREPVVDGAELGERPGPGCRSPRRPRGRRPAASVSSSSRWPLGRHHSTRPARLRRAISGDPGAAAVRRRRRGRRRTSPPPRAAGGRRAAVRGRSGGAHPVTVTSALAVPRVLRRSARLQAGPSPYPWRPCLRRCREPARRRPAPARAGPAAAHRARRAVRGRGARAGAGRRPGARRVPRPAVAGPGLHDRRATPEQTERDPAPLGRRALGRRPRVRHDRRAQRGEPIIGRGHDLPRRRLRPRRRASPRSPFGDNLEDDLVAARLHRQRDGAAAARRWSSSTRTAGWPTWPRGVLRTPGHPGGVVRRRPAADDAGRPVRRPARAVAVAPEVRGGDDGDGRPASRSSRPSGCATS